MATHIGDWEFWVSRDVTELWYKFQWRSVGRSTKVIDCLFFFRMFFFELVDVFPKTSVDINFEGGNGFQWICLVYQQGEKFCLFGRYLRRPSPLYFSSNSSATNFDNPSKSLSVRCIVHLYRPINPQERRKGLRPCAPSPLREENSSRTSPRTKAKQRGVREKTRLLSELCTESEITLIVKYL